VEVTAETVAVNATLEALAGTVTDAGRTTAELLLDNATVTPPLGAGPLRLTVQASLTAPVTDALVQESALSVPNTAVPVPLRLTAADGLVEEVLLTASCPVAAPTVVGSNTTLTAVDCPGLNVTGKVPPDILKPVPATDTELTVTGTVPMDVKVRDCAVAAVFTVTLPKDKLLALRLRVGTDASSATLKVLDTPPALAVSIAA